MKQVILLSFFGFSLGATIAGKPPFASAVKSGDCHQSVVDQASPITDGPYKLVSVYCPPKPSSSNSTSAPSISPDGRHFFIAGYDSLLIGKVGSPVPPLVFPSRLTFTGLGYSKTQTFSWRGDSRAILGVRQDTTRPSGFARGPLSPIEIRIDGESRALPALTNAAGGLDGMLWVGDGGLAIAEFGTKGDYYRPEHDDPMPTLAMVDGRQGKVLQTVPMPSPTNGRPQKPVGDIDARLDRHGKIFALFRLSGDRWFKWQQGDVPREIMLRSDTNNFLRFTLSPDLKMVLVARWLSAQGWICEHYTGLPQKRECEERTPQSGTIADLWDIETGRKIWTITGTAYDFSRIYRPSISHDGRYALLAMPPDKRENQETIALISMIDGHEIQRFNAPHSYDLVLRFARDGRSFSIDGSSGILTYRRAAKRPT